MPGGNRKRRSQSQGRARGPLIRVPERSPLRARRFRVRLGRGWWLTGVVVAAVAVVLVIEHVSVSASPPGSQATAPPAHVDFASMPGLQTGAPPWGNDAGTLRERLASVGLDALAHEQLAFHIHQHLDVYVNGRHVTVPEGIGIGATYLTELHTHTANGILHVESAQARPYTLGQFFGEWGVRLSANCLGRYCGDLHWWVDGTPQKGNPAYLVLREHQEIVIAAGTPPAHIPASYNFPPGL
jgi:hypothetical protein